MTPLCHLAAKYGTDKGVRHHYTEVYYDLFKDRVDDVTGVFEFGVKRGASLRMWRDFFPQAQVFGFDIKPRRIFSEPRITCFQGDQDNARVVNKAGQKAASICKLDLIVDDASHKWKMQLETALTMLKYLARGGVYVIEDVQSLPGKDDPEGICRRLVEKRFNARLMRTTQNHLDSVLIIIGP